MVKEISKSKFRFNKRRIAINRWNCFHLIFPYAYLSFDLGIGKPCNIIDSYHPPVLIGWFLS